MESAFDIQAVIRHFSNSIYGHDDIYLESYVKAYDELRRLFRKLGVLFSFVESDMVQKCDLLKDLTNTNPDAYVSVKSMIEHECLSNKNISPRGARNLLRLHRALAFLIMFVDNVSKSDDDVSVPDLFLETYQKTLAIHHGWFIRKSIGLAVKTTPSKPQLNHIIFNNLECNTNAVAEQLIDVTNDVYNRIQTLYEKHDLLNLP